MRQVLAATGEGCRERGCQKRHRKLCRYWKSKSGCFRGSKCKFLHEELEETITENYESSERSAKRWGEEKCDVCKFEYFEKEEIIKHKIENHRISLCLLCDQMITDKSLLINTNFDMRDL